MKDNELKKAGVRPTAPRVKILQLFEEAHEQQQNRHMSAEDVYNRLRDAGEEVSLATVYRALTQFEAAELLVKHRFEGGHALYELDQGPHHDHLVCVECQAVEEFFDEVIEERQEVIAHQKGFEMTNHNLIIYGICRKCQTAG